MNKDIKIFGKIFSIFIHVYSFPFPIFRIAILDDSYVGAMLINVGIIGLEFGIHYIG